MRKKSQIATVEQRKSRIDTNPIQFSLLEKTTDPFQIDIEPPSSVRSSQLKEMHQLARKALPQTLSMVNQTFQMSNLDSSAYGDPNQTERRFMASQVQNSQKSQPEQPKSPSRSKTQNSELKKKKSTQPTTVYRNPNYPYFNLTLTFHNMRAPKKILIPIYIATLFVRLVTVFYLIFVLWLGIVDHQYDRWIWIVAWVVSRLLFIIMVYRVSFSMSTSLVQNLLKNVWNRRQDHLEDVFERITFWKICSTTQKALVPPQFSLVYLFKQNKKRRYELYAVINFIYLSIEAIVFYPFIIGYCVLILSTEKDLTAYRNYTEVIVYLDSGWLAVFAMGSLWLLLKGIRISREKLN